MVNKKPQSKDQDDEEQPKVKVAVTAKGGEARTAAKELEKKLDENITERVEQVDEEGGDKSEKIEAVDEEVDKAKESADPAKIEKIRAKVIVDEDEEGGQDVYEKTVKIDPR